LQKQRAPTDAPQNRRAQIGAILGVKDRQRESRITPSDKSGIRSRPLIFSRFQRVLAYSGDNSYARSWNGAY
jgi:hypothetical protein